MILDEILGHKKEVVSRRRKETPLDEVKAWARVQPAPRGFGQALTGSRGVSLIAEIKRASPSAGWIRSQVDPAQLARAYARAGASAISVLTEEAFFKGSFSVLRQVRDTVTIPVLCKDFIIDPYQIYEARGYGADAVLLIAAVLDDDGLGECLQACERVGMDALVEAHTREETERAVAAGAWIIGINNRDLKTFRIDLSTTEALGRFIPEGRVRVSESGIRTREDVSRLEKAGADAVLVGTLLMESEDVEGKIREILGR